MAARKAAILLAGGGVYGTTVYVSYHYLRMTQNTKLLQANNSCCYSHVTSPTRTEQFQRIAECYDEQIGWDERFTGMNLLRRALLFFHARGTCLEVGAGTARNLPYYYRQQVDRVVLTDASDQMLAQAQQKIQKLNRPQRLRFALLQANASQLDLPNNAFETVIDTFGLCSYDDPVAVLRELARVCKPNGKILLLEHGRSHSWKFVTEHLDAHAEQHAANWGCVWNRDLDAILEQASDSLEISTLSRYHFGTTYYVVCRPKKQPHTAS